MNDLGHATVLLLTFIPVLASRRSLFSSGKGDRAKMEGVSLSHLGVERGREEADCNAAPDPAEQVKSQTGA